MRELIDVDESWARDDDLDADTAEHPRQFGHQLELARRPRREVGVAALGRERNEAAVEIVEHADAHPGPGGDDRGIAARYRDALLQDGQLVRLEHRYGIGERFEIVDDLDTREVEAGCNRFRIHQPRYVREARHLIGDRARDADARRGNRSRVDLPRAEKLTHHRLEAVVVERDELADFDRRRPILAGREETEERLGAADITGQ